VAGAGRDRPAQHGPDPGLEVVGAEGLDDEVVRAGVQCSHRVVVILTRGDDDDRDRAHRAHHAEHLEAVDVGQPEVEEDDVGPVVDDRLECRHTGTVGLDDVTAGDERPHQRRADRLVVFDDQDDGHRTAPLTQSVERRSRPPLRRKDRPGRQHGQVPGP
jgi:hypothetical protein